MLFFGNNTTVPLFLPRVRTAQQPYSDLVITNTVVFASTVLDSPLGCAKLICFVKCLFFMPYGSLEKKCSSENRNAVWKTYN